MRARRVLAPSSRHCRCHNIARAGRVLAYAQPPDPLPEPVEPPESQELPEEAVEGQAEGEARAAAADAHAKAIQDWTDCVAAAAAAQGDEVLRQVEPFDPTAGCGEKPEELGDGVDGSVETTQGPPEGTPDGPLEARRAFS
jgi:hypothetical protein